MSRFSSCPWQQAEGWLHEQANVAFNHLMFVGQSPWVETTTRPREWSAMPPNYQKAPNLVYGQDLDDSTFVCQQAQGLVGLKSWDDRFCFAMQDLEAKAKACLGSVRKLAEEMDDALRRKIVKDLAQRLESLEGKTWDRVNVADVVVEIKGEIVES